MIGSYNTHTQYTNTRNKMSEGNCTGYQCEFVESVPDNYKCQLCSLVAKRRSVTSCCGESFCHEGIRGLEQGNQPCPTCGEVDFTIMQLKNQQKINNLQVYCTFKERECGWSGRLQDLEVHLDPDQNECQYMDISCPLHCNHIVPRNAVQQHTSQECVKREHTCQHCNYKASYEEVMDVHLPDCQYVPLQCPNRCGVTCEREMMEDHLKICLLEEVACKFERVGCKERPRREDLEEHGHENMEKHLALTSTTTVSLKEEIDSKIDKITHHELLERLKESLKEEMDSKNHELEEQLVQKFKKMIANLEKKLIDKDQKIEAMEKKLLAVEEILRKLKEDEIMHEIHFPDDSPAQFPISFQNGHHFIAKVSFLRTGYAKVNDSDSLQIFNIDFEAVPGLYDDQKPTTVQLLYTFFNGHGGEIYNGTWEGTLNKQISVTTSRQRPKEAARYNPKPKSRAGSFTVLTLLFRFNRDNPLYMRVTKRIITSAN